MTDQSPSPDAPHSLSVLERITYANEDTGYAIARVATGRTGPDLLTVVGPLLGAQVGESLRLTGHWGSHPKYGRQFQVHSYTSSSMPTSGCSAPPPTAAASRLGGGAAGTLDWYPGAVGP